MPLGEQAARYNVALGKPARQSSVSPHSHYGLDPQGGVDGVKNGRYGFHTACELNPWWEVDLQGLYEIEEIVIYNRLDSSSGRANTLRILVSEDGTNWRQLPEWTGGPFGGIDGKPARVRPNSTVARYVRLQLNQTNYLHLDEVEVYGGLRGPVLVDDLDPNAAFDFRGL